MSDYRSKVLTDLKKAASNLKGIKLPDQKRVSFPGYDKNALTISLRASAVTANMQTDVAAFEAWALAFHYWLDGIHVSLEWEKPDDARAPEHSAERGHYNRFLFRTQNFTKWFSWFNVPSGPNQKEVEPWKPSNLGPLFLNRRSRLRCCRRDKPSDGATENEFERYFTSPTGREEICRILGWQSGYVLERQIPVGLFKGDPPTKCNTLFSRGKSAMDLCAVDGTVAHVIELKKFKAPPKMGVLAEVLLYAALVRGVQKRQIGFAQENSHAANNIEQSLLNTRSVQAHILAPRFHPLLDCEDVLIVLNSGLARDGISVGYLELKSDCGIRCKYNAQL